ncbi:MAG TPA: glycoside hydrolase family 3 N-terminal domain-containing protein [Solirubrobacteraceae bacterium]|jgi:beta-N-acetylhexosaminidase|nr:glycoside hydrolase family 3 N-terminal domain-containing protein [Solirubrobacteraceae bacterium]
MRSRPRLPVLALLLVAVFVAAVVAVARNGSALGGRHAIATSGGVSAAEADLAASARRTAAVQKLTADELAGQRIIYAYAGLRPPASLLTAIRAGEAGGVIFFGPNISSVSQIRGVIAELQRASLASPLHTRLLMLTDQEGGEVRRLPGAPALSEKQIGRSRAAASLAHAAGTGAGHALAGVGMNVNLAPVLDVYRRPGNFIDEFQRSYSSTPSTVATLGAAFVAAQQRLGVAATAKHFPGLGAAAQSQNTDLRPVNLGLSAATLRSADEAPYRTAIAAGVKLVMTSWAVYPALDPFRPAGLSPTVIQGELRRRLRFRGVTITDGIDAGAVTPYGSLARRSVLAAQAGADLILCAAVNPAANSPAQGITAMHAIAAAIGSRGISTASAQQAAARILALRSHP